MNQALAVKGRRVTYSESLNPLRGIFVEHDWHPVKRLHGATVLLQRVCAGCSPAFCCLLLLSQGVSMCSVNNSSS